MGLRARFAGAALWLTALFSLTTASCLAGGATLKQQIDPANAVVGVPVMVTLTVTGGTIGGLQFPTVDGLAPGGTSMQIRSSDGSDDNGSGRGVPTTAVVLNFALIPTRPGDFTLPAFDIHTQEGDVLRVKAMKLHVVVNGNMPAAINPTPAPPPSPDASAAPGRSTGPVVMPPANVAPPAPPANANPNAAASAADSEVPRDKDGSLAKVFLIISLQTTNAYVGQAVGMQIDFFIRMDVAADQNSLPTIKGSDFLMNSFVTRGHGSAIVLENEQYIRETWQTAISAPKSGDFPLSMERDTYWIKGYRDSTVNSLFGNVFGRQPDLAHEMISSNLLTMHILPLPEEGRPAHFTGAIGQFRVAGEAQPATVGIGEPVTLRYEVSGEGNFDYVRCPALADDPAWKTYSPRSGTNYLDESHMQAVKTFEQSVIPRVRGNVPLPASTFSYFDPATKQYVTVPIDLPHIVVTGSSTPIAESAPDAGTEVTSVPATPRPDDFQPNRLEIGELQTSLVPAYRHAWFWAVQTALVALPIVSALMLFIRARNAPDAGLAARQLRERSVHAEEDAMSAAVGRKDAPAFFHAARHAVQLQLGAQWSTAPEALTLGEIRRRDPQLAERLAPFFAQADEVIYSGRATPGLDLVEWDQRVRTELLQPQPA